MQYTPTVVGKALAVEPKAYGLASGWIRWHRTLILRSPAGLPTAKAHRCAYRASSTRRPRSRLPEEGSSADGRRRRGECVGGRLRAACYLFNRPDPVVMPVLATDDTSVRRTAVTLPVRFRGCHRSLRSDTGWVPRVTVQPAPCAGHSRAAEMPQPAILSSTRSRAKRGRTSYLIYCLQAAGSSRSSAVLSSNSPNQAHRVGLRCVAGEGSRRRRRRSDIWLHALQQKSRRSYSNTEAADDYERRSPI